MVFSRDGSFIIKCTFPRVSVIQHNKPFGSSIWYPDEAAWFILNSLGTGSVAVQWEGPCTLAKLSVGVLASETSIFAFILIH